VVKVIQLNNNTTMADFCTKCSPAMFGEDVQPDIDILKIADDLKPGYFTKGILCEGCGLVAVIREEDLTVKVGLLPDDLEQEGLNIMLYEDFLKIPNKF
jgi:hypothetical protein